MERLDTADGVATANTFGYNVRSEVTSAAMGNNTYSYGYDPIGNRVSATNNAETLAYSANALNQYTNLQSTASFLYDGWNVVREIRSQSSEVSTNYYTWGLDLSGSMQGAGGVGGLLAVTRVSSDTSNLSPLTYYPTYDANGNVTAYLDATGGVSRAFSHDPFGNTVSETGNVAPGNAHLPYRFSTKYFDAETGMYDYGYRFYLPELMRFLNRDPITERGGLNLYGFVGNNPVNRWDVLGFKAVSPFEFVGANSIVQDSGIYLGLWFGANDYLDQAPAYALFTVSLNVNLAECKVGGRSQTFNGSNNFLASRASGDRMISSNEIYLNPLNSRSVGKNDNGSTGGWRDFITSKKNGKFCTHGTIKIEIQWNAMSSNPFGNWNNQSENYDPWWHDQTQLPNNPKLPDGFDPKKNSFANGTQSISISWKCEGTDTEETSSPKMEYGSNRAKNSSY